MTKFWKHDRSVGFESMVTKTTFIDTQFDFGLGSEIGFDFNCNFCWKQDHPGFRLDIAIPFISYRFRWESIKHYDDEKEIYYSEMKSDWDFPCDKCDMSGHCPSCGKPYEDEK